MRQRLIAAFGLGALLASLTLLPAANWPSASGTTASGVVLEDGGGNAVVPASSAAVGTPSDAAWSGTGNSTVIAALKAIYNNLAATVLGSGGQATAIRTVPANDQSTPAFASQYPFGATALTASATGTTAATVATLAANASKTTYICGFTITSDATAGLAGAATVTGTVTGTLNYVQGVAVAPAVSTLNQSFAPCVPGSAINIALAVTSAAAGVGGVTAVTAWGFQL